MVLATSERLLVHHSRARIVSLVRGVTTKRALEMVCEECKALHDGLWTADDGKMITNRSMNKNEANQ